MLIIDRFEDEWAVVGLENKTFNIPKLALPKEAKEGDIIILKIDKAATEKRKQAINKLTNNLFED